MDDILSRMVDGKSQLEYLQPISFLGKPCGRSISQQSIDDPVDSREHTCETIVYEFHVSGTCYLRFHDRQPFDHSWVAVPLWLMWDSYGHISGSLWQAQASAQAKKE